MYAISKKYNTSVDELISLNNLKSNVLTVGQTLKIPTSNIYTVVKGDSLYSIAKKYNTTVSDLIDKNNLSSSMLSIGQKLIV